MAEESKIAEHKVRSEFGHEFKIMWPYREVIKKFPELKEQLGDEKDCGRFVTECGKWVEQDDDFVFHIWGVDPEHDPLTVRIVDPHNPEKLLGDEKDVA